METTVYPCSHDHVAQEAYVKSPTYSHSTVRNPGTLWENVIWSYRHDPKSPTMVILDDYAPSGDARCPTCTSNLRPNNGPTRGSIAEGWRRG